MDVRLVSTAFDKKDFPPPVCPEVVFLGRSNVGKSTLINSLLNNKKLAKTSATPGKTRSINFYQAQGLFFVDLPGYGYAKVSKEMRNFWEKLILDYFSTRKNIALAILLVDIRREMDNDSLQLIRWFENLEVPYCIVLTKADKVSKSNALLRKKEVDNLILTKSYPTILFSAHTGEGKREVWKVIEDSVTKFR